MDTNLLKKVEDGHKKKTLPNIAVGDTVALKLAVRDENGEKKRSQVYQGLIISMSGHGVGETMVVRKISNGVGVEKILPIHSPNVEEIKIIKKGKVRQSKIYYMRGRIGKRAMKVNDSSKEIEIYEEESEPEVTTESVEEVETPVAEVAEEKAVEEEVKKD